MLLIIIVNFPGKRFQYIEYICITLENLFPFHRVCFYRRDENFNDARPNYILCPPPYHLSTLALSIRVTFL